MIRIVHCVLLIKSNLIKHCIRLPSSLIIRKSSKLNHIKYDLLHNINNNEDQFINGYL